MRLVADAVQPRSKPVRFKGPNGWRPIVLDGVELFNISSVPGKPDHRVPGRLHIQGELKRTHVVQGLISEYRRAA